MRHEGKYIYGIILTEEAPNFGPIGIGGKKDEVVTIGSRGLAAVVSNTSLDRYVISPENLKAHTRVIEKVAETYTILPMRFCTIAEAADEVVDLLEQRNREIKNMIRDLEGKVEVGIKIVWKNMKGIYEELGNENKAIRAAKAKGAGGGQQALIRAGELVEVALEEKKAVEGEEYMRPLKKHAIRFKNGEMTPEEVVSNMAFLIDRDWLKEFDAKVEQIGSEHDRRIDIKYVGPMPPFSFVDLELQWENV